MAVKKARPLPVECIVRGYLSGSGWKEYQASGGIAGLAVDLQRHDCQQNEHGDNGDEDARGRHGASLPSEGAEDPREDGPRASGGVT